MMQEYRTPSVGTNLAYAIKKCMNSVEKVVMIDEAMTDEEKQKRVQQIEYFEKLMRKHWFLDVARFVQIHFHTFNQC